MRRYRVALMSLACIGAGHAAVAAEPEPLLNNPFSRPPSVTTNAPTTDAAQGPYRQVLDLRATMVGRVRRIVDVGGRILHPGDEIDGYTLIEVGEDRALFVRGDKRITVYVRPERVEGDDETD